ncbi:MAG TPA: UbiA family prenyltransferase, partial [Puia sp.]|nr:UbiA family prenyltransferase [Puia sp.]
MSTVKNYLSLVRFSHTIFAMPFALIGFFLGVTSIGFSVVPGWHALVVPGWHTVIYPKEYFVFLFVKVVLCMVFARSAAMAFNRWLDVKWDALNPRTAIREIPAGIISKNSALWFVVINCLLFITCTWFI